LTPLYSFVTLPPLSLYQATRPRILTTGELSTETTTEKERSGDEKGWTSHEKERFGWKTHAHRRGFFTGKPLTSSVENPHRCAWVSGQREIRLSVTGSRALWPDLALCRQIGRSMAGSSSLSPDREICGQIRLSVVGSGALRPNLSFSDVVSVRNSPVVEGLEFGRWIET